MDFCEFSLISDQKKTPCVKSIIFLTSMLQVLIIVQYFYQPHFNFDIYVPCICVLMDCRLPSWASLMSGTCAVMICRTWKKLPKHEGFIASVSLDAVASGPHVQFIRWSVHGDWIQQVRGRFCPNCSVMSLNVLFYTCVSSSPNYYNSF